MTCVLNVRDEGVGGTILRRFELSFPTGARTVVRCTITVPSTTSR